jgi:phosphatidate cytidylyltransferase
MAKRILVAVIGVPFLLAVILLLPGFWWALVVALIAVMAAYELLRAAGEGKITLPMELVTLVSALVLPLSVWYGQGALCAGVCGFVVLAVSFWCAIRAYDEGSVPIGLSHVLLTLFAGCVIPLGLSALVQLRGMDLGRYLVLLALLLTFVTDGAAYFGGVFLGKHRGVTRVSPKKSVEGYLCGFVGGAVFAVLYGLVIGVIENCRVSLPSLALCGLLGALTTELGDLIFSLIKRQYGVKDYGHVLPGHGGMLDRFDSMIVSAPVVLFIVSYLPVFLSGVS